MSQGTLDFPVTGTLAGLTCVGDINAALDALGTDNSGASAPTNQLSGSPSPGNRWLNVSVSASLKVKYYDGADYLIQGYIDTVNHIWQPIIGGGSGALAAAATTDLGSVPQSLITVTGSASISSLGSSATVGSTKTITFASSGSTLVNSANLILPGGQNIPVGAGDVAQCWQVGAGQWIVIYQSASGNAAVPNASPSASGLVVTNDATTPNSQIDITADSAQLVNSTNAGVKRSAISVAISTAASGAGGLDTGAVAPSTWYNVFLIDNGSTTAGLISLSATAPTLPSGYAYVMRIGAVRTDGSSNLLRTLQRGSRTRYKVTASTNTAAPPVMVQGISGSITTPTWTAQSVSAFVPPTAAEIDLILVATNSTAGIAAPNNAYGGVPGGGFLNPPPLVANNSSTAFGSFLLESSNVYYAGNAADVALLAAGWKDKVNAS